MKRVDMQGVRIHRHDGDSVQVLVPYAAIYLPYDLWLTWAILTGASPDVVTLFAFNAYWLRFSDEAS